MAAEAKTMIQGSEALGCLSVLMVSTLGATKRLDVSVLDFRNSHVPPRAGAYSFGELRGRDEAARVSYPGNGRTSAA